MESRISEDGYILDYLSTKVEVSPYKSKIRDKDQLKLEERMRKDIVSKRAGTLSKSYLEDHEWHYRYSYSNIFLDYSDFYSTPAIIKFSAVTSIVAEKTTLVTLRLWTYASAALYQEGKLILSIEPPRYKPIGHKDIEVSLKEGANLFEIELENLGVRDSMNLFAIQILTNPRGLSVKLPIDAIEQEVRPKIEFLDNLKVDKNTIILPSKGTKDTYAVYPHESENYEPDYKERKVSLEALSTYTVEAGHKRVTIAKGELKRTLEIQSAIKPIYTTIGDNEERFKASLEKIAEVKRLSRGDHGFAIFALLAKKALGVKSEDEQAMLYNDLALIVKRTDCSDFVFSGLLRYYYTYGFDEEFSNAFKEAALSYRFWMDMAGQDGMCFWSENHSLMFYTVAYLSGSIYPNDHFEKANMSGGELKAWASKRISDWLEDVNENLFEEFQSSVYMCVTFAALLNVFDFTEFKEEAEKVLDKLVQMLAVQVFDGAVISPMGRVYRGAIYPFQGAANSILSIKAPALCYDYAEGWISFYATSGYEFKQGLKEQIKKDRSESYVSGNARINTEKNDSYILTSLSSPREDNFTRWENTILSGKADISRHSYTKSMNERFHGTSCIQPGVYGYQQHLWYAALSSDALIFVNHPGSSSEASAMRPGYWYGNGVFPAIKQQKDELYVIYNLPEEHPIKFVHAYIPFERFDDYKVDGNWVFLKKHKGYIALWSSVKGKPHNDMLFGAELRYRGDKLAFFTLMGKAEAESFDAFISRAKGKEIRFSFPALTIDGIERLKYVKGYDESQIVG